MIQLALFGTGAVLTALVLSTSTVAPRSSALARYADGAPPGFSGGFKEQSCDGCHFQNPVNTRPGEVVLAGVPDRFVANQQYTITVTLTRTGMKLGGFQLAARFPDGMQAGRFERGPGEEKRLAVEAQNSVQYVNQKRPGADPTAPDSAKWTVLWIAPADSKPVTFDVAANAADNDETARGDYVYTASVTSKP